MPVMPLMLGAWYVTLFTIVFVMVCLILILVVLIQKPRGSGLTGAFGGAGGGAASVFGSKTGDVLTWITVVCFALFMGMSMLLTWTARSGSGKSLQILNTNTGGSTDSGGGTGGTGTEILDAIGGKDSKSGSSLPKASDGKINPTPEVPKAETKLPDAPKAETKTPDAPKTDGK